MATVLAFGLAMAALAACAYFSPVLGVGLLAFAASHPLWLGLLTVACLGFVFVALARHQQRRGAQDTR